MRYRLLLLLSVVVACVSLSLTGSHLRFRYTIEPAPPAVLPHSSAGYLGVYEAGVPPNFGPIETFARTVQRQPNLVGYYSGWVQPFALSFAQKLHNHHMIPYVQIDPMYANVSAIAAGTYDQWLRTYADSVRTYAHSVVIGFGHEMNAPWYSWGYGHVRPKTFVAAWRHIVTLFNNQGARNVTWLWTINQDTSKTGPISSWWPGSAYVTWVGIDGYYFSSADTFKTVFGRTIKQVHKFTHTPILLSETAVAPQAVQSAKIPDLFTGVANSHILGLVWFDMASDKGVVSKDWQIEDNPTAQSAFVLGARALNLITP